MSIQYLVPCSCGRKTPVETRQAGEVIICTCGAALEIPRLLQLKTFEKAPVITGAAKSKTIWGLGQGLILSGVVVLLAIIAPGVWLIRNAPQWMTHDQIRENTMASPPLKTWQTWRYLQNVGLNPRKQLMEQQIESVLAQHQMVLIFLGIAAAVGVALLVIGILVIRRK